MNNDYPTIQLQDNVIQLPLTMKTLTPALSQLNLAPYAGRWIAVIRGRVGGAGRTAREAAAFSKTSRPKEEPIVLFVPIDVGNGKMKK